MSSLGTRARRVGQSAVANGVLDDKISELDLDCAFWSPPPFGAPLSGADEGAEGET